MIITYAKYYTMHTLSPLHREGGIDYFNNITRVAHRLIVIQSSYESQSCKAAHEIIVLKYIGERLTT